MEIEPWLVRPDLWLVLSLATVITIASTAWKRIKHPDECPQMNWMDWCGHYALTGILVIIVAGVLGLKQLAAAGVLLLLPLYPIALLGILGKLDDAATDIIRAIRRR